MGNTLKNWARGLGIVLALAATSSYGSGSAPQISGTPSTEAVVGQLYNFKARTVDAEGDTLTVCIGPGVRPRDLSGFGPSNGVSVFKRVK